MENILALFGNTQGGVFALLGPIPVGASAGVVEAALNSLWSIKPDTVQVSKQGTSQSSDYTVTFKSNRGKDSKKHKILSGSTVMFKKVKHALDLYMVYCKKKKWIHILPSLISGDFEPLWYEVFGSDTNITVTEVTKGHSSLRTFTLLWGGVVTKPISYNASESEVCHHKNTVFCFSKFHFDWIITTFAENVNTNNKLMWWNRCCRLWRT